MHPIGKIIFGIILIIGSIWWVLTGSLQYIGRSGIRDFLTVVNGIIPPLVFLIGIMIVWLELDELRIEKQLAEEERKRKPKRK